MNIVELVKQSQGGQSLNNLAKQFGLDPAQAQAALQTTVPALVSGLKTQLQQNGLQGVLASLQSSASLQSAQAFGTQALAQGNQVLTQLLGAEGAKNLVTKVSQATGLDAAKLQQAVPALTNLVMGVIAQAQGKAAGVADAAMQSPLGQMAGGLLGKLGGAGGGAQNAAAGLLALLDGNGDGKVDLKDLMGAAGKFLKR